LEDENREETEDRRQEMRNKETAERRRQRGGRWRNQRPEDDLELREFKGV
jgi:hypothetical protein